MNYFSRLDPRILNGKREFWKPDSPIFKAFYKKRISRISKSKLIRTESKVLLETFNYFFSNIVEKLQVQNEVRYKGIISENPDDILNLTEKYKNYPSIVSIKNRMDQNKG